MADHLYDQHCRHPDFRKIQCGVVGVGLRCAEEGGVCGMLQSRREMSHWHFLYTRERKSQVHKISAAVAFVIMPASYDVSYAP